MKTLEQEIRMIEIVEKCACRIYSFTDMSRTGLGLFKPSQRF